MNRGRDRLPSRRATATVGAPSVGPVDIVLDVVEARVLGSLLEKERTVPATYPLTMSALLTACNQSTSRDPVMVLSEAEVAAAIESLKDRRLVRRVLPSHGNRVVKYRQVADEVLGLDDAQRAVVTLLLLRGPQTPMELRARTERIHPFADAEAVERTLSDMAGWGEPLVRLLPRRPGQREARWAHLLSGEPSEDGPGRPAGGAPAAEQVAAPMGGSTPSAVPAPDPAVHGPLAALAGTWVGPGQGRYPTVDDFTYAEQLELVPVPGKPLLAYQSSTRAPDGARALHAESGFFRLGADGTVELVVAAAPGIVEACSGVVEDQGGIVEVVLASDVVAGTPTAVEVTATERTYRVEGDVLTYEVVMAAAGQPSSPHLRARLTRA